MDNLREERIKVIQKWLKEAWIQGSYLKLNRTSYVMARLCLEEMEELELTEMLEDIEMDKETNAYEHYPEV